MRNFLPSPFLSHYLNYARSRRVGAGSLLRIASHPFHCRCFHSLYKCSMNFSIPPDSWPQPCQETKSSTGFCQLYKTRFFLSVFNVLQFTFPAPFIIYSYVLSSEQSLSRNYSFEHFCRPLIISVVRGPAVSIYSLAPLLGSARYHGTPI